MGIWAETRDNLVERICRLYLHDWREGTADAAGTNVTLKDDSRNEKNDFFNSLSPKPFLHIRTTTDAAAPQGEEGEITDFENTGGIVTVGAALGGVTGVGDTYAIILGYSWAEIVEAINQSIDMIAEEALVWKVDEASVTLVADQYEYELPTSFMYLNRVTQADSDGNFYDDQCIPTDQWSIVHAATPLLKLHTFPREDKTEKHYYGAYWAESSAFVAGSLLRLEGLASPATLSTDAATCPVSPAFVCAQAAALLHGSRIEKPEGEYDPHRVQAEICQGRADVARGVAITTQLPPNSKRVRE